MGLFSALKSGFSGKSPQQRREENERIARESAERDQTTRDAEQVRLHQLEDDRREEQLRWDREEEARREQQRMDDWMRR